MLREDNIQNQVQSVVYSNSLVVHDCLQVSLRRASENQSFRLFFLYPLLSYSYSLPRKAAKHFHNGLSLFVFRNAFLFEERKKIAVVVVNVFFSNNKRNGTNQSDTERKRGEKKKKKKIVVYQYVFTFHFPPLFLPFDLFYINFCVLLLGRSQLKREDLQE